MTVEYGVVIRRQPPQGALRWQLWLGSGMLKEHTSFLVVMNHAGAMGFEAVAAGHFDELGVPEVLLQRKMEASAFAAKPAAAASTSSAEQKAAESKVAAPAEKAGTRAKAPAKRKPAPSARG